MSNMTNILKNIEHWKMTNILKTMKQMTNILQNIEKHNGKDLKHIENN
jgi:hypothetical protein